MGFSSSLQGEAAHEALISRQDAELRLLDNMKRCLSLRVKCDREYAIALNTVVLQVCIYCDHILHVCSLSSEHHFKESIFVLVFTCIAIR